ncbi:hypothetical protein J2X76_005404 [Neorhizobium sp. 2083]|nr:hypothetical protein [Neorhizobium sp. 2083]
MIEPGRNARVYTSFQRVEQPVSFAERQFFARFAVAAFRSGDLFLNCMSAEQARIFERFNVRKVAQRSPCRRPRGNVVSPHRHKIAPGVGLLGPEPVKPARRGAAIVSRLTSFAKNLRQFAAVDRLQVSPPSAPSPRTRRVPLPLPLSAPKSANRPGEPRSGGMLPAAGDRHQLIGAVSQYGNPLMI